MKQLYFRNNLYSFSKKLIVLICKKLYFIVMSFWKNLFYFQQ